MEVIRLPFGFGFGGASYYGRRWWLHVGWWVILFGRAPHAAQCNCEGK